MSDRNPRVVPKPGDVFVSRSGRNYGSRIDVTGLEPFGARAGISYLRNGHGPFRWWREYVLVELEDSEVIHAAD